MPTLSEYYELEARAQLARLDELLDGGEPDGHALQRVARELRGVAQMARVERVQRAAQALEHAARALAGGDVSWDDDLRAAVRGAAGDLRVLVERSEPEHALDARLEQALARWRDAGLELPGALPAAVRPAPTGAAFRAYVADEVEAIAAVLEVAVRELAAEGMNREPLRSVLRRQRALLGSARLDDIPVVAEILRAVEDLTRVIVRLDVAVKQEWLDIFRIAHEGLRATVAPLRRDEDPGASNALARLRHMRAELIERYGTGDPVNTVAAGPDSGAVPAAAAAAEAEAGVPIEELEYRGEAAVQRALELHAALQRGVPDIGALRAVLDELVDLVRLARQ
jgi:chemotaxis protein histidine kinase CheA